MRRSCLSFRIGQSPRRWRLTSLSSRRAAGKACSTFPVFGPGTSPVVLRLGMIYGRGILMIEAARWLARRRLLCVWREPTTFQLLSTADFLRAAEAAIFKPGIRGIYHVGDDQPVTLQSSWTKPVGSGDIDRPIRIPFAMIYTAAWLCECVAGSRGPRLLSLVISSGWDACPIGAIHAVLGRS